LASTALFNLTLLGPKRFFQGQEINSFIRRFHSQLAVPSKGFNIRALLVELESRPNIFCVSTQGYALRTEEDSTHDESADLESDDESEEVPKVKIEKKAKRGEWCHQCKQKHQLVVHCTRSCTKKYCPKCLLRHYGEKESDIDKQNWICVYCRDICTCAFCRKRKAHGHPHSESKRGKKRGGYDQRKPTQKRRKPSPVELPMEEDDDPSDTEFSLEQTMCSLMDTEAVEYVSDPVFEELETFEREPDHEEENSDEQMVSEEDLEIGQLVTEQFWPRFEIIKVADHYHWLKYELQHSPDDIHCAQLFDSRLPVHSEIHILDTDCEREPFDLVIYQQFADAWAFVKNPDQAPEDCSDLKREDASELWADSMFEFTLNNCE